MDSDFSLNHPAFINCENMALVATLQSRNVSEGTFQEDLLM